MPSSTKWRLSISANNGGAVYSIAEIQMRASLGGADECSGGTASASSSGFVPANAFDNDAATFWYSSGTGAQWIQYEFAAAKEIMEFSLQARPGDSPDQTPRDFALEYWDGAAWVAVLTIAGETNWVLGETRSYSTVSKQAWRLYVTDTERDGVPAVAELQLRASLGGADECTGGTAAANGVFGNNPDLVAAKAFDDSAATVWGGTALPGWVRYTFSEAKNIVQYVIQAGTFPNEQDAPLAFKLQYRDGSGTWIDYDTQTGAANWDEGESRTYPDVPVDAEPPTPGAVTVTGTDFDEITVNVGAGSDDTAVVSRTLQVFSDSGRTTQVGTNVEASVGDNVITGLTINTTYWVRVIYADAAGNTANGDATGSTLADTTDPTPGTVTVTGLNDTQLNVSVGAGSDNVAVTSRTLKVYSDAGRTAQVGTDIAANAGDNTVSGLTAETTYYVTVIYADAAGNTASVDAEGTTFGDCWIRVAQAALEVDYTIPSAALLAQAAVEVDLTGTTSVQLAHAIVEIDYVLGTDDDGGGDDGGGTPNDGTTVPPMVDEEIILGYDPQKHRIGLAVSYAVDEVVKHDLYTFDNEAGGWGRLQPTTDAYDFDTVTCRATAERDADAHLLFGNVAGQSLRVFDPDNAPVSWEWRSKEATGADFGGFAKTFQFTGLRVDWHRADPTLAGSVTATVFVDGKAMPALNIAEQTSRTYVLGPRATGHRCSLALEGVNAEVTALRYSLAEARN